MRGTGWLCLLAASLAACEVKVGSDGEADAQHQVGGEMPGSDAGPGDTPDAAPADDAAPPADDAAPPSDDAAPPADDAAPPSPDAAPPADDCLAGDFLDVSGSEGPGDEYGRPMVAARCDGADLVVTSNGLPTYRYVPVTPNGLAAQDYEWHVPRRPAMAAQTTAIPLLGTIGFSVNGIPIYGPNEAATPHPYGDPIANSIMDMCLGHTAQRGDYHYHGLLESCFYPDDDGSTASPVLGVAADGFPIYGSMECADAACSRVVQLESGWEATGTESVGCVDSTDCGDAFTCALAIVGGEKQNACVSKTYAWDHNAYVAKDDPKFLDECNGHVGPDGTYHYHATDTFPYVLGCYRGTPANLMAGGGMQPGGGGMQPGGGGMGPPPDAVAACNGMHAGDACAFDARDGHHVVGLCRDVQGQLACAPAR
jgi:hypothetical protein